MKTIIKKVIQQIQISELIITIENYKFKEHLLFSNYDLNEPLELYQMILLEDVLKFKSEIIEQLKNVLKDKQP